MPETTKLEAVNTMLSCIGEAPVNSLDGPRSSDTAIAVNILDEVNREIQSRGWWFNMQSGLSLAKDGTGKVAVPASYVHVDHPDYNYVKRGGYLYNLDDNTDVFTSNVENLTAVILLDFTQLPEAARRYVTMRASRSFFERMVGEAGRAAMLKDEESQAYLSMLQADAEQADLNIFNNDYVNYQRRRF
jgi:hypothetical protein